MEFSVGQKVYTFVIPSRFDEGYNYPLRHEYLDARIVAGVVMKRIAFEGLSEVPDETKYLVRAKNCLDEVLDVTLTENQVFQTLEVLQDEIRMRVSDRLEDIFNYAADL